MHMTGIFDSLINIKLSLEGCFQSADDNYIATINVKKPGRFSFKMMHPLDTRPKDGFPASFHKDDTKELHSKRPIYVLRPTIAINRYWLFRVQT